MMVNFLGFDLFILVLLLSVPGGAPWAFPFFIKVNAVALSRTSGHIFEKFGRIRSSTGHNFARRASCVAGVGHYESSNEKLKSGEKSESVQEWFFRRLELSTKESEKIVRCVPSNLWARRTAGDLEDLIQLLLRGEGISEHNCDSADTLLTFDEVKKVLVSRPQLLQYRVSNFKTTLQFFVGEARLDFQDLSRMIRTLPLVMTYSVDRRLRPTVNFLQYELGGNNMGAMNDDDEDDVKLSSEWTGWRRVISRYPQIFSHSVETTLRPKIDFLSNELSLSRRADVTRMVYLFPPILWLSNSTIESKCQFLRSELEIDNEDDIRDLLVTYPQLLGLSIEENLRPTVQFFLEPTVGGKLSRQQLKEFVLYQPALLAYSLEKRIRPRLRQMSESNIRFEYAPMYLMSLPDIKFDAWLRMQENDWSVS